MKLKFSIKKTANSVGAVNRMNRSTEMSFS
jgi:hypothetical protein